MKKQFARSLIAGSIALLAASGAWADDISPEVLSQMATIASVKATFTPAQKKLDSGLAFGILKASNDARVASLGNAFSPLSTTDLPAPASSTDGAPTTGVTVDIAGSATDQIAAAVTAANGVVRSASPRWGVVTATVPLDAITSLAQRADVRSIRVASGAHTNIGAVTSQGYVSHEANKVVSNLGITGAGVTVGVLSDSALPARVAALIASGDLPADTQVLPGQAGPSDGEDEGAAMMEIVHDMAPGAKIIFATAFTSEASFADNILALAAAGCKVIVDDITYFDEGVFQDGIVAQAVNQVTAQGVVYVSSAANSGSLTKGTSGTWEGDFKAGGTATGVLAGAGTLHDFSTTATAQTYDVLTAATSFISIKWSDPLGASTNDYDLYLLNSAGTAILDVSAGTQDGTQDPFEIIGTNSTYPAGSRIVIAKYAGVDRALHLDTERGRLSIATSGATFGHNAGASTLSMAATYWNSAKTGTRPFTGFANTNETFSSDGPRKVFYNANGTAITPGNVLFASGGGTTLNKPDLAAADGVSTKTPGFLPFFGTSAAAPHAAGIAALVRAARPDYTVAQVKQAMYATALDSMSSGVDRDSGYGVATAYAAVQYALSH